MRVLLFCTTEQNTEATCKIVFCLAVLSTKCAVEITICQNEITLAAKNNYCDLNLDRLRVRYPTPMWSCLTLNQCGVVLDQLLL